MGKEGQIIHGKCRWQSPTSCHIWTMLTWSCVNTHRQVMPLEQRQPQDSYTRGNWKTGSKILKWNLYRKHIVLWWYVYRGWLFGLTRIKKSWSLFLNDLLIQPQKWSSIGKYYYLVNMMNIDFESSTSTYLLNKRKVSGLKSPILTAAPLFWDRTQRMRIYD